VAQNQPQRKVTIAEHSRMIRYFAGHIASDAIDKMPIRVIPGIKAVGNILII